jgi:hypothetical protein
MLQIVSPRRACLRIYLLDDSDRDITRTCIQSGQQEVAVDFHEHNVEDKITSMAKLDLAFISEASGR